jgi:hypothetical protein
MSGPSWDEVGELLSTADEQVIRAVVETGASLDEIGAALSDIEAGYRREPLPERVEQVRNILAPLYGKRDDTTFSVIGVPI